MSSPFRSGLKQAVVVFVSAALLTACASTNTLKSSQYTAQVILGSEQQLIGLYSWPNQPGGTESLADTIKHYLQQTVTRDGFSDVNIVINAPSGGMYSATLTSSNPAINGYPVRLPNFLSIGQLGYDGAQAVMKTPIWQSTWRFFLPLGLAMENQASVQLLHFPPDYSLPAQDYLGSKTSQRWESLLEANGVPPANVTLYEAIVDIAPIAAPANDGSKLTDTYPYFADYAHKMLNNLAGPKQSGPIGRPVVAYGSPVRDWVQQQFGVTLKVNGTDYLKLSDTVKTAALGANHPSYFWYAADQSCDQGWSVMQQDLISARWQMIMGTYPDKDPNAVLNDATSFWGPSSYPQICQMTRQQASQCATAPIKNCP